MIFLWSRDKVEGMRMNAFFDTSALQDFVFGGTLAACALPFLNKAWSLNFAAMSDLRSGV